MAKKIVVNKNNLGRVVCRLPKAGLGNQLFPLVKAYVFGELNGLPVTVTGYHHLKIGPWLRREKTKRKYRGFFRFQKNILGALWQRVRFAWKDSLEILPEPVIRKMDVVPTKQYFFSAMPHWDNYFNGLKENRELAIDSFWKIIKPGVVKRLHTLHTPCIGVHIRMGDFRKLKAGEDFNKVGAVRTPEPYFVEVINNIRKIHDSSLPVSVFTDGYKDEFEQLLKLENVEMVEGNNDLVDLLLLSKSKIIVTSAGSTFSYWAGFLSDVPVILHPGHLNRLRPISQNIEFYEGAFDPGNQQLVDYIKKISC